MQEERDHEPGALSLEAPIACWDEALPLGNGLTGGLLSIFDVLHGLVKGLAFGIAIAACSTAYGINAKGGPPGVGRAVGASVVMSAALIFAMDALVSLLSKAP